jgi:hypothetical protein
VVPAAGGFTFVPSHFVGAPPPNIEAMQPKPIAELSIPQVCEDSMQQPESMPKPGMLGAGHIALSGGAVHAPPAPTQPQPPSAKQQGVASIALGTNILSMPMEAAAGFVQVIAPHMTEVVPAPAAPPLAAPAGLPDAPVLTPGCCCADSSGSVLLPQPAIKIIPAIAATKPLVVIVFIAARLCLSARRMRNAALAQDSWRM